MITTLRLARLAALALGSLLLGAASLAGAANFSISDAVEFNKIIDTNAAVTVCGTVNSAIEGPVWVPDGGYLVFSDVRGNKLKRLDLPDKISDFLTEGPQVQCNGNTLDLLGRIVTCECGRGGLQVGLVSNGVIVPLVTDYHGSKFFSPNDVAVKSDGSIWFTDPGYDSGIPLPPNAPQGFQPGLYVYRFVETNGNATVQEVITNVEKPNGICFSPDETKLYVADNGVRSSRGTIMVYDITSSNTLTGGKVFANVSRGISDGFRCDVDGRVWSSAGDGVEIFAPDGHLIGKILLGRLTNLCFGGPDYKTIFTTGQPYVSSIPVKVAGAVSKLKHSPR